jgi:hypothetical protein
LSLLLLRQREFYNLRALLCILFCKELSFALKLKVFFFPFSEFLEALLSSLLLLLSSFFPSLSLFVSLYVFVRNPRSLSLSLCVRQESALLSLSLSVFVRNPRCSLSLFVRNSWILQSASAKILSNSLSLLLLRQREFYNLRALMCKLFWKELSFAHSAQLGFLNYKKNLIQICYAKQEDEIV